MKTEHEGRETENKVDTSYRDYVGNFLQISGTDYSVPAGWNLPPALSLHSCWVRSSRGVLLGRSWYLQHAGEHWGAEGTINHVSSDVVDGSLEQMQAFLAHHGYRETCPFNAVFEHRREVV